MIYATKPSQFITPLEIIQEKQSIIMELKLDAVFKLLTKLEADIRQDYNKTMRAERYFIQRISVTV